MKKRKLFLNDCEKKINVNLINEIEIVSIIHVLLESNERNYCESTGNMYVNVNVSATNDIAQVRLMSNFAIDENHHIE